MRKEPVIYVAQHQPRLFDKTKLEQEQERTPLGDGLSRSRVTAPVNATNPFIWPSPREPLRHPRQLTQPVPKGKQFGDVLWMTTRQK